MSTSTINVLPSSSRSTSVLVTANLCKFDFKVKAHQIADLKTEAYLKVHPLGKAPSIETPEGNFYESNAIARYIARKNRPELLGESLIEQAQVDQYLDTIRQDLAPLLRVGYKVFGWEFIRGTQEEFIVEVKNLVKALKFIDAHLSGRKFLVGEKLTLADVILVCDLNLAFRYLFLDAERKELPNLTQYFYEIVKIQEFKNVLGVFVENNQKLFVQFGEKKEHKKQEPKKEEKKVEKKKEEKKPAVQNEEVEEKKPEVKFPESAFKFHDFKTTFTNAENRNEVIDFLFKNFDTNAFSVWFFRYDKLPSEGKKLFLTKNFLTGFLSRADQARKHTIGSIGIYGEEGDFEVKGVWMWKGTDMLPMMKEHQQWEYFQTRQLDVSKPEDQELLREYWTKNQEDVDKVEGLTVRDWTLFK